MPSMRFSIKRPLIPNPRPLQLHRFQDRLKRNTFYKSYRGMRLPNNAIAAPKYTPV